MQELTKEQAVAFAEGKRWEPMSLTERANFQLRQPLLCMPFSIFQESVEHLLGRPVWTHEFARPEQLIAESEKREPAPDLGGVIRKLEDLMR